MTGVVAVSIPAPSQSSVTILADGTAGGDVGVAQLLRFTRRREVILDASAGSTAPVIVFSAHERLTAVGREEFR